MDISLVPADDLIDELARRNDAIIFGAVKSKTSNMADADFVYRGGVFICIGLIDICKSDMIRAVGKALKET